MELVDLSAAILDAHLQTLMATFVLLSGALLVAMLFNRIPNIHMSAGVGVPEAGRALHAHICKIYAPYSAVSVIGAWLCRNF